MRTLLRMLIARIRDGQVEVLLDRPQIAHGRLSDPATVVFPGPPPTAQTGPPADVRPAIRKPGDGRT